MGNQPSVPADGPRYAGHSMTTHGMSKIVTVFSTTMFVITVALFLAGYLLNPSDHYLSLGDDSHFIVLGRGLDSRAVIFNDARYGPYRGSIIGLADVDGSVLPRLEEQAAFGDSWGIYYRYFRRSDSTIWTLTVTLWYPMVLFAVVPVIGSLRGTRRRLATRIA